MVTLADTSTSRRLNRAGLVIAALVTLFSATVSHASPGARYGAETVRRNASMRLSAGVAHTCQVNEDGSIRCWGTNGQGELGDGTRTQRRSSVRVTGITAAIAVAAGGDVLSAHSCAVLVTGAVSCWGGNNGRLGDGTDCAEV